MGLARWFLAIYLVTSSKARSIPHRFARLIQQAVLTLPTTYRESVAERAT